MAIITDDSDAVYKEDDRSPFVDLSSEGNNCI